MAAVTTGGFVLTQDNENLYVQGAREVQVGDMVSLNGAKSTFQNCPTFFVDELTIVSSGTMSYPDAPDVTDQLASFKGGSIPYITLRGSLVNGTLKVGNASIVIVDPVEELGLDAVDLHKVTMTGYAVGINGATGYLVATSVKDEGADESLVPYPLKWAIGKDQSGPVEIIPPGYSFYDCLTYKYDNGIIVTEESFDDGTPGLKIYGDKGYIRVCRGIFEASDKRWDMHSAQKDDDVPYETKVGHHRKFINAIRTRVDPNVPVEVGHSSCTVCNLGNIAMELGRPVVWNPIVQKFMNDPEATKLMHYDYRPGYSLDV